jgi:DNA polymerase III delta prime subunit/MFS family permease
VNGQDSQAEIFDVFLCHNGEDKREVRMISQKLAKEGIKPWLDEEQIRPGTSWQTALGQQIESIKSAAVFVGESGFGPWQNQEIQALLSQFVERSCPVIPVILLSAKTTPDLPWTLKNIHYVDFRGSELDPLKQLIWGITGQKPAPKPQLLPSRDEDAASHKVRFGDSQATKERYRSRLAQPPDQEQAEQLEILRRRVKEYWVDGVLKHSLYNELLISLGERQVDEFVDAPWKYTVEVSDAIGARSRADQRVRSIYDATGLLLVMGEPGSGKTTTLLDLARTLLERARQDIKERVPVVVNLSAWKKKQPLAEWIAVELSEKYRVPKKIARLWLQYDYLVPLLDGLDEVPIALQPDCVAAINAFVEEFNPPALVVCCRLSEYRWFPKRLKLNGAICLEPLSSEEVSKYLAAGGSKLEALREAVDTDSVLQELAQTPLMLSVMSLACQAADGNELAGQKGDSLEERRKQIFGLYVEQMFRRKGTTSLVFPKEKIIGLLSWLAEKMREHSQSVFLVEGLQPSWLGTKANRAAYGAIVTFGLGLIFELIFGLLAGVNGEPNVWWIGLFCWLSIVIGVGLGCWSDSPLKNGLLSGSIGGLVAALILGLLCAVFKDLRGSEFKGSLICALGFGVISGLIGGLGTGSLNHIASIETISWNWNHFFKRTIPGLIFGLIAGLTFWLVVTIAVIVSQKPMLDISTWLIGLVVFLVIGGAFCGFTTGLIGGFTDTVRAAKASPNEGIKLSGKNSLAIFLVIWFIIAVPTGMLGGLISWLTYIAPFARLMGRSAFFLFSIRPRDMIVGLLVGLITGLTVGLIASLNRGGSAVIKHYALRLILWLKGYTPFNFIKFLDHCAKLIFLKKVGGGYIFVHRMLLEYFANLLIIERSDKSKGA